MLQNSTAMWNDYPEVLTAKDVADLLRIGKNRAYELCKSQGFPAVRFGRSYRISKTLLLEWYQKQAKLGTEWSFID